MGKILLPSTSKCTIVGIVKFQSTKSMSILTADGPSPAPARLGPPPSCSGASAAKDAPPPPSPSPSPALASVDHRAVSGARPLPRERGRGGSVAPATLGCPCLMSGQQWFGVSVSDREGCFFTPDVAVLPGYGAYYQNVKLRKSYFGGYGTRR